MLALLVLPAAITAATPSVTLQQAFALREWTIGLRRDLHKCPELLYELKETSAYVRSVLDQLHIPYQYPVAQEGIVATIGTGEAPCVALRADMDALPIHEEVASSYRSQTDGKMRMPIWARAPLTDR
jgi:metal-dependent amidase/aminoacylase/carboxypeptidase family protein